MSQATMVISQMPKFQSSIISQHIIRSSALVLARSNHQQSQATWGIPRNYSTGPAFSATALCAGSDPPSTTSTRIVANFPSTIWGHHFLSYTSQLTDVTDQEKLEFEELKERVREMLVQTPDNTPHKLVLIDAIQRLGVAYHFHDEVETSIHNVFHQYENTDDDDNLFIVALRFRLVRQQGHYMSSDVFNRFTNSDGKFKAMLTNDVQGLLSLYEAAHLRVHGEEILEEALTFTTTCLETISPDLNNSLKVQVIHALNQPIRKTVPRVGARKYLSIYENMEPHDDLLLKFAKLNCNILQKLYQKELSELTRWWKDLDFPNKLPYIKDRLVELYAWAWGMYSGPQYSRARIMLTKVAKLTTVIDDTYDSNYATFDELVLFTDAIQRWNINAMDSLPPYQRPLYQALLDVYNEMEHVLTIAKLHYIYYPKNEMKRLVKAFFKEAEWLNAGYIPKCEEYKKHARVTSALMLDATTILTCADEFISKETFEWIGNEPPIIRASSAICRLMDDVVDHEVEQQRGHVASIVECYMKEYGASEKEACTAIGREITGAWKDINKELLGHNKVPMFVLEIALNFAQMANTILKDEDVVVNPESKIKDLISLLFVEPVNI